MNGNKYKVFLEYINTLGPFLNSFVVLLAAVCCRGRPVAAATTATALCELLVEEAVEEMEACNLVLICVALYVSAAGQHNKLKSSGLEYVSKSCGGRQDVGMHASIDGLPCPVSRSTVMQTNQNCQCT